MSFPYWLVLYKSSVSSHNPSLCSHCSWFIYPAFESVLIAQIVFATLSTKVLDTISFHTFTAHLKAIANYQLISSKSTLSYYVSMQYNCCLNFHIKIHLRLFPCLLFKYSANSFLLSGQTLFCAPALACHLLNECLSVVLLIQKVLKHPASLSYVWALYNNWLVGHIMSVLITTSV